MRSAAFFLCVALPFSAFAQTKLPPGNGKNVWTVGYALKKPDGGLATEGVEQGTYWQGRSDGKCDIKKVRIADTAEFEANRIRTAPPALTITEEVGECPVQGYVF